MMGMVWLMNRKVSFLLLSVLFLGTVSVFAGNVFVGESGISASYYSENGSEGLTETFVCVDGNGGNRTLIFENGLLVNATGEAIQDDGMGILYNTSFEDGASYTYQADQTKSPPNWTVVASDNQYFGSGASVSHGSMSAQDGSYFYVMVSQYNWYQYMEKSVSPDAINISFYAGSFDNYNTNPVFKLGFYDSSDDLISESVLNLSHGVWQYYEYSIPSGSVNVRFSEQNPSGSYGTYFYLDNVEITRTIQ